MKKKRGILNVLPAIFMTIGSLLVVPLFLYTLVATGLFPEKYLIVFSVLLLLIVILLMVLLWRSRSVLGKVGGIVLSVLLWLVLMAGTLSLTKGVTAITEMSTPTYETAVVSVYVANDDPAQNIEDAQDYTFGILAGLDRENTDAAVSNINKALGKQITVVEYNGITELADALLWNNEIQAVIMNSGYLGLYVDIDGYHDVEDMVRELDVVEVRHEIQHAVVDEAAVAEAGDAAGNFVGNGMIGTGDEAVPINDETINDLCFSVFISGIDSRGGLITLSRSDVNILATVNTATRTVLLVSTPRDYFVPLSISNGVRDKLTHAGIYGIDCCVDTIGMLYNTDVDYYFRVNFSGFENIVDALGGVTVYSEYSFTAKHGGYSYVAGENYVNGAQALSFARERYAFASGDRQRGKNQQALIKAIAKKAMSPSMLLNYSSVLESLSGSFETTMPYALISGIVKSQLEDSTEWTILSYSVDGEGASMQPYSLSTRAYVMVPYQSTVDTAIDLMNRVRNGERLTQEDIG